VIGFDRVGVTYDGSPGPVLLDVSVRIEEGELCLVIGHTGSGKSTFLGAINGLVPYFTGGTLSGRVVVNGRDTAAHRPRELADVVGVVGQDPLAGFVTDTVEEELAYTMEQLAIGPAAMRTRLEETLDLLGLADLRHRALATLSGGQQQRVAIGAAMTAHPQVLVLDEPTSALDPASAEDVLAAITRLVHDLGVTVVLAEHRLERVLAFADRVIWLAGDGTASHGEPGDILRRADIRPPVVELGQLAGWEPLPLSVRDARRRSPQLRQQLPGTPPRPPRQARVGETGPAVLTAHGPADLTAHGPADLTAHGPADPTAPGPADPTAPGPADPTAPGPAALAARGIVVRYGPLVAVRAVDLTLRAGECTALMGRNGSGKSSLLWALQGTGRRASGALAAGPAAADPAELAPARARRLVGLVPQTPADLLYLDTVAAELAQADRDAGESPAAGAVGTDPAPEMATPAREILDEIAPGITDSTHPRDLSAGQQLALVLAIQLRAAPAVILLDEPTRGLDYRAKASLTGVLDQLAAHGHAVVVATHDVEFVTRACDRVIVMAEGEIVTDGPAAAVLTASPTFAPQIAKILAPLPYLTVAQVAAGLDRVTAP
jgi:energy-coupling factor transporter ATP-binding protein EcfA2